MVGFLSHGWILVTFDTQEMVELAIKGQGVVVHGSVAERTFLISA